MTYAAGQILVPVRTFDLMLATGMTRAQLTGADLTATANVTATVDSDVHLHDWQVGIPDTRPASDADDGPLRDVAQALPLTSALRRPGLSAGAAAESDPAPPEPAARPVHHQKSIASPPAQLQAEGPG